MSDPVVNITVIDNGVRVSVNDAEVASGAASQAAASASAAAASAATATTKAYDASVFADAAAASAVEAFNSATAAEAAANSAMGASNIYPNTTAGLAGTTSGEYFGVVSPTDTEYTILYLNSAGTAVQQKVYPSKVAVDRASENPLYTVPVGRSFSMVTPANVTKTGQNVWSRTTGTATIILDFFLGPAEITERTAGRPVTVRVPFTGTWTGVTLQQYTAANATIGGTVAMSIDATRSEQYLTLTLDPTCAYLRLRGTSATVTTFSRPYFVFQDEVLADPTWSGWKEQAQQWAQQVPDTWSGDLFNLDVFTTTVGTPPTVSQNGRVITFPAGTLASANCYIHGVLTPSDYMTLVLEAVSMPAHGFRAVSMQATTGAGGGTATNQNTINQFGNYYFLTVSAAAAAGAQAYYASVGFDNRTLDGTFTPQAATLRIVGLFKGGFNTKLLTDIANVEAALAVRLGQSCTVDPAQGASGGSAFTDIISAFLKGYGDIQLAPNNHYRLQYGMAIGRRVKIGMMRGTPYATGTQTLPVISAGIQITPAQLTPTANPLVYYYPQATNPANGTNTLGMWEVTTATGATRHLGIDIPAPTLGLWKPAANEAEVQSNAGAYWWGAGSAGTGIYIRPWGDTTSGKVWEFGGYSVVITASRAELTLDHVDVRYATNNSIEVYGGVLRTNGIVAGYAQYDGAIFYNGAQWYDLDDPSLATENMNDGWGTNSFLYAPVRWILGGTRAEGNNSDGFATHGSYMYVVSTGTLKASNNGKQGFPAVVPGFFDFDIDASGNRSSDVYFEIGAGVTTPTQIFGRNWFVGSVSITHNSGAASAQYITGRVDRIQSRGPATLVYTTSNMSFGVIEGYGGDSSGNIVGGSCVQINGGSVTIDRLFASRYGSGLRLNGGSVSVMGGHLLRNTVGINQTGGTLNLSASSPVNVFGNTTQFSGVSAGDQAKTVSFNMT